MIMDPDCLTQSLPLVLEKESLNDISDMKYFNAALELVLNPLNTLFSYS